MILRHELLLNMFVFLGTAMGVNITKFDELDNYNEQINEIGEYQITRLLNAYLIPDITYKWLGYKQKEEKITKKVHYTKST